MAQIKKGRETTRKQKALALAEFARRVVWRALWKWRRGISQGGRIMLHNLRVLLLVAVVWALVGPVASGTGEEGGDPVQRLEAICERMTREDVHTLEMWPDVRAEFTVTTLDEDGKRVEETVVGWERYEGDGSHTEENVTAFLETLDRNCEAIEEATRLIRSSEMKAYLSSVQEIPPYTAFRRICRLQCVLALGQHYRDKSGGVKDALGDAVAVAVTVSGASDAVAQLTWPVLVAIAQERAAEIYGERGVSVEDAIELMKTFEVPATGWRLLKVVESAFTAKGPTHPRTIAEYRMVRDFARGGEVEAGEEGVEEELSAEELARYWKLETEVLGETRERLETGLLWPAYVLGDDKPWRHKKLDEMPGELPLAALASEGAEKLYASTNRLLARYGLLTILLQVRIHEAQVGSLPDTLEEMRKYFSSTGAIEWAMLEWGDVYTDVFSGEPYRYALEKDAKGNITGCRLWSVGPDGDDDGGKTVQETGDPEASDIVVRVKRLAADE
jgi:hypothetical protein